MVLINTIKQNIFSPSLELQAKYTLWMNHFLIAYIFLLPISRIGKSTAFFFILILFILRKNFKYYLNDILKNPIILALLSYVLLHILWIFGTEDFSHMKKILNNTQYLLLPIVFLSFMDKRFIFRYIAAFLSAVFFSEITSYMISLDVIPWKFSLFGREVYQAYAIDDPSPFLHHSKYGTILALGVSFLLLDILTIHKTLLLRLSASIFIVTATINLGITGGRLGYLTYLTLLIALIVLVYKKQVWKPLIGLTAVLTTIFILAYQTSSLFQKRIDTSLHTIERLQDGTNDYKSSFGNRVGQWVYSIDAIKDNLLFGVGTGDHLNAVFKTVPKKHESITRYSQLHNDFISVSVQFGLIGLLIYLNIYYQSFKYSYPSIYQKRVAVLTIIAVILAGMTEAFIYKFNIPLLMLFLSIAIIDKKYQTINIDKIDRYTILTYAVLILLCMLIAFVQ